VLDITDNHAYINYGSLAPAVQIKSVGGSTATANDTARMWPKVSSH
jgi:hypothetical protein